MAAPDSERLWLAILNPAAGGGQARRVWPRLAAALAAAGVAAEAVVTRGPGDATELAGRAFERGTRRFLAVGGDGTLNEIVNGLGTGGERAAVAAAPLGTGNDWARGLGVPRNAAALARMLKAERRIPHDLGRIEYALGHARATHRFLNVAGLGYDADVLGRLGTRGPRSLRYLWAVVAGLARYQPPRCVIDCDGRRIEAALLVAFAAIGRYCGGGLKIAPAAAPGDGLLDLAAVRAIRPLAALVRVPKLYLGTLAGDSAAITGRAAVIRIDADRPTRVEADGQLLGLAPIRVEVQRGAIDAIVPCDPWHPGTAEQGR